MDTNTAPTSQDQSLPAYMGIVVFPGDIPVTKPSTYLCRILASFTSLELLIALSQENVIHFVYFAFKCGFKEPILYSHLPVNMAAVEHHLDTYPSAPCLMARRARAAGLEGIDE